jgi:hypothetical protein
VRIVGVLIASVPLVSPPSALRHGLRLPVFLGRSGFNLVRVRPITANRARPQSPGLVVRAAFALFVAAGAAGVAAVAVGARSVPAVVVVALGFAICSATGLALATVPFPFTSHRRLP